jgi:DNA primase catalytic subunit
LPDVAPVLLQILDKLRTHTAISMQRPWTCHSEQTERTREWKRIFNWLIRPSVVSLETVDDAMKQVSLDELTFAKFSALLNAPFRVHLDQSNVVQFKLVAATGQPESFSVVFSGPADRLLPQKIYSFEQDQLGSFDLFIVPIGKDAQGIHYEAIVNRVSKPK